MGAAERRCGDMYSIDLSGKNAVVLGVANHRSIAWHIAQALHSAGANLYLTYQNERLGDGIRKLTDEMKNVTLIECDVSEDENVESAFSQIAADGASVDLLIHSIAFANRDDLGGDFSATGTRRVPHRAGGERVFADSRRAVRRAADAGGLDHRDVDVPGV